MQVVGLRAKAVVEVSARGCGPCVCGWCGRSFTSTRAGQAFCSRSCASQVREHSRMRARDVDDRDETQRIRTVAARQFARETGLAMDEGARRR